MTNLVPRARLLDDNKPKTLTEKKVNSHCFKLHQSYSVSFNMSNVGEIFWVESEIKFRRIVRSLLRTTAELKFAETAPKRPKMLRTHHNQNKETK